MSVTPVDFLENANALATSGNKDEMTKRNVLSRAYYAAYHRAIEIIPFVQAGERDVGMHRSYFTQLLQKPKGSIERKVGEKLKSMFARRIKADYWLDTEIQIDDMPVQLHSSRALFALLEKPTLTKESKVVVQLQPKR